LKINVRDYRWIGTTHEATGFIAQELHEVIPAAVKKGGENIKKDPWMIDYSKLTPFLVKAVQDFYNILFQETEGIKKNMEKFYTMQGTVEENSRRIASLEQENQVLNSKLKKIEDENTKLKTRLERIEKSLNINL
jgi:predicted nuclease with TOPRIM domain